MGRQKEFQAEDDRALRVQLITLLWLKSWCEAKDKPQKHTMVRETAREIGIHRSSVRPINRKDLACRQCRVCRCSNNDSLKCTRNYCVYGSICPFKFPKVVLARISGEVGTLCIVLLNV